MAGRGSHALTSERNWSSPAPYHLTASKLDTPSRRKTKDSKKASHGDAGGAGLLGRASKAGSSRLLNQCDIALCTTIDPAGSVSNG